MISELKLSTGDVKKIRGIIRGNIDPASVPACQQWIDQCYNRPSDIELRLSAINAILDCHGVEAIPANFCGAYPRACYCNAGDTYNATILFDYENDQFLLTSWGDFYENNDLLDDN